MDIAHKASKKTILISTLLISVILFTFASNINENRLKFDVPESYSVDTIGDIKLLNLQSFDVDTDDHLVGTFKNSAIVDYSFSGYLSGDQYWQPRIKEIDVSERFIEEESGQYIEIFFRPVVVVSKNESYSGGKIHFSYNNQHKIHGYKMMEDNKFIFKMGQYEKSVVLKRLP